MRFRRISFPISAILSIAAILLYFFHGLNFGIDFVGGTLMEVQTKAGPADLAKMRGTIGGLHLGDFQLQQFGAPNDVLIRISEQPGGDVAQQQAVQKVREALGNDVEYRRVEVVGPSVSTELLSYGTIGLVLAIGAILIYLWFRFEWQFALGAMIANVHDLVLTVGFMSLTGIDFDLTSIAALLTILGYSLNDTVVIYDRIREMLRRYKRMSMPDLLNASINATLSRSIVTHFDGVAVPAGAAPVRRACDPQLHRHHDVRRRAGRHLYVGVHCLADPDLSRRRPYPAGRAGGGRGAGTDRAADRSDNAVAARANVAARAGPPLERDEFIRKLVSAFRDHALVDDPHLPQQVVIDAHGEGGFRFGGMSHRGSLLCLPDGVWAWPVATPAALTAEALAPVFARAADLDFFLLGTGSEPWMPPPSLRARFRETNISFDVMATGPAVRTYNVMFLEGRRVAAGLIAHD